MTTDPVKAREIKNQLSHTFDEIAPHFDSTRYKPWPETKKFVSSLPREITILDLGCGNGRNSLYIAKSKRHVVGLDFSPRLLKIARNKLEWQGVLNRASFVIADVTSLPLNDISVDAAIYIATLHHLPTPEDRLESLKEVKRCLKPGSEALINVWAQEQEKFREELKGSEKRVKDGWEYGDIFLPWKDKSGRTFERYYHLFSRDEFETLLKKSMLEILEIFWSSDNHYAKVRKK